MKVLDKLKDMFTYTEESEEDEGEVKIEHITKEPPKIVKEEKKEIEEKIELEEEDTKENPVETKREEKTREDFSTSTKVKTPVFFTENDFADLEPERPKRVELREQPKPPKREEKKLYSGSYTSTTILTKEKPTFKPTPIISPIFGVLGENYNKDEIVERNETSNKHEEKNDSNDTVTHDKFDEIRNKAYGTLENELEDTIYDKNSNVSKNDEIDLFDELEEQQDDYDDASLAKSVTEQEKNIRELEEITMDLTKELDNLLLKKESFNSKKEKVSKQMKESEEVESPLTEDELFNLIDSMYEEGKE